MQSGDEAMTQGRRNFADACYGLLHYEVLEGDSHHFREDYEAILYECGTRETRAAADELLADIARGQERASKDLG